MTDRPTQHASGSTPDPIDVARGLSCWSGPVDASPLSGGLTNTNFLVRDGGHTFVVRMGDDLPLHGIVRRHEVATCRAAYECGLAPEIVHHEPGALVMRYLDAKTLTADDVRDPQNLTRIIDVIGRCHRNMKNHLRGATVMFWVFQVCRDYLSTASQGGCRLAGRLAEFGEMNDVLERAVGPIQPVFCHNDLLPANLLDDGKSIWLIDWEYAGWNTALFDLANLASNSGMNREQQLWLLGTYFGKAPEPDVVASFDAMTCTSLLRESLWGLVQEQHSELDFDFESYTDDNLARLDATYRDLTPQR